MKKMTGKSGCVHEVKYVRKHHIMLSEIKKKVYTLYIYTHTRIIHIYIICIYTLYIYIIYNVFIIHTDIHGCVSVDMYVCVCIHIYVYSYIVA